jgi:plasmid stabilization system protein ParE
MHNIEQLLPNHPQMGRPGSVPGTRELVIPKTLFIFSYRLKRNIIQILRVYYGAIRWPESF